MDERELKEKYKSMFDGIHASDELKSKILSGQKRSKRNFTPIIAAVSSVAAAVVMVVSVKNYDFNSDANGVISEVVSEKHTSATSVPKSDYATPIPTEKTEDIKLVEATQAPQPKTSPAPEMSGNRDSSSTNKKKNTQNVTAAYAPDESESPTENITTAPTGISQKTEIQSIITSEPPTESPIELPTETSTQLPAENRVTTGGTRNRSGVLLNINSPLLMPEADVSAITEIYGIGEEYTSEEYEEYIVEEWDNDRYFDYIGTDIINDAEYSEDLIYTSEPSAYFTVNSRGEPLNDTRIFTFSGNNGRFVRIVTSKDLTYANAVISSDEIVKSNINGTSAAAFAENDEYSIYMIYNGTAYIIYTSAIAEDEICTMLASLAD